MFFDWLKPKPLKIQDQKPTWEYEYGEDPHYDFNKEHEENMATFETILKQLDEIRILIDEMKKENG